MYSLHAKSMALNNIPQTLGTRVDSRSSELGSELDEEDLEKLESDVKQMAEKIAEYRATLPDKLKNTLSSILSAQRPVFPGNELRSEPGPSGERNLGQTQLTRGASPAKEELNAEKMHLIEDKISSNISAIPVVIKRTKECIAKLDKLDSCTGTIHPAFKKKKTS